MFSKYGRRAIILFLIAFFILGCGSNRNAISTLETDPIPQEGTISPTSVAPQTSLAFDMSKYSFPESVDSTKYYLFYLHGKIIEDQGIPAVSPDYGEYEYKAILEKLGSYGFVVISEQRGKNTNSMEYAKKITEQITALLKAGVPARNITIVGASKGAGITIFVSHLLENEEINYVIMAICNPATLEELKQNEISLHGNVLSIYDSTDELAGSCQDLFSFSEGKGIFKYNEIVLDVGTGHGILFKPLDEWIIPVIQWAGKP
jgi:hypothetical protein